MDSVAPTAPTVACSIFLASVSRRFFRSCGRKRSTAGVSCCAAATGDGGGSAARRVRTWPMISSSSSCNESCSSFLSASSSSRSEPFFESGSLLSDPDGVEGALAAGDWDSPPCFPPGESPHRYLPRPKILLRPCAREGKQMTACGPGMCPHRRPSCHHSRRRPPLPVAQQRWGGRPSLRRASCPGPAPRRRRSAQRQRTPSALGLYWPKGSAAPTSPAAAAGDPAGPGRVQPGAREGRAGARAAWRA